MQQHLQTHHLPEIIACSSHPHVSDLLAVFSLSLWTVSHGHCLEALSRAYVATTYRDTPHSGDYCVFQPPPPLPLQLACSQCFICLTVNHGHCLESLSPAYVATASTDTPLSGNCCEFQPSPQLAGSQCFLSLWTVTHGQCLESLSPAYVAATSTDTPLSGDCCVFH